jgi:cytoskeletal protein CcmA (bactofilin family)
MGALATIAASAFGQEFADTIVKRGPAIEGDLYLAGRTVEIATEVRGDLVVAGQHVGVSRPVSEDLIVAGETVRLTGPVADDVRAAGRLITLTAPVGDHVVAAGEQLTLTADASTGGRAWLAGRVIQVLGTVGGDLAAAGQEVVIGGTVHGNVKVYAETIRVLESARIKGRLEYGSREPLDIADGAIIEGDIKRIAVPDMEDGAEAAKRAAFAAALVFLAGLFLVGLVFLSLFAGVARSAADAVRNHPGMTAALGLGTLVIVPLIAIVLMATVVGLLPGLALLASYVLVALFGYVNGVSWLSRLVLDRRTPAAGGRMRQYLAFAITLAVLAIAQLIPLLGLLAGLAVWIVGTGSLVFALARACRIPTAATTPLEKSG